MDGLPIGIQLGAAHSNEDRLLSLSADLERALPWCSRLPNTHVSRVAQPLEKMYV